ncbi:MAG: phage tail spike protein, partial [Eubacterium sp.]
MIEIYAAGNENFDNNGDMTLTPSECLINANINADWTLSLKHPIDDWGRWKYIQPGAVIKANSFNGYQLFRIYITDKTETEVTASAFPVFLDAANEVFIVDKRPTKVDGQSALNQIFDGTKYTGKSDIVLTNTAYY